MNAHPNGHSYGMVILNKDLNVLLLSKYIQVME